MNEAIIELGYRPKIVHSRVTPGSSTKNETRGAIPEPVASAIEAAAHVNKPLFVDFFAEWCGACKTMDRTTFKDPMVKKALEQFVFLKVDTDLHPATASYFNIIGMPTLVVLDASGGEIYRQVGPISATDLTRDISVLPSVSIAALPASKSIAPATPPSGEPRDSYHVHVSGLACPFCVYGLESSIGAIAGVDSVAVDLKTGLVRISVGDGVILDEALVRETILDAGFTVEAIEPTTLHDLQQIRN